jgi:arginase
MTETDHSRRALILSSGGLLAATLFGHALGQATAGAVSTVQPRTYMILGVPLRSGSLYPGTEDDARAYREAGLVANLERAGCRVIDAGDLAVPSYLPHHAIPPIRSWPGPRIVWDTLSERLQPLLKSPGQVPLLVGCDCSVVIGTAQALMQASSESLHVLYVDGDFDDAPPTADRSQSAASLAVWLLTHPSPFWTGPVLRPSQVTVIGCSIPSRSNDVQLGRLELADVRRLGPQEAAQQALSSIPRSAQVLLHLDVDVFQKAAFPVAYFPHEKGLTLSEGAQLIGVLARDPRLRVIEISEYSSLRDNDLRSMRQLVDILTQALRP